MTIVDSHLSKTSNYYSITEQEQKKSEGFCSKLKSFFECCCPKKAKPMFQHPPNPGTWAHGIYIDLLEISQDYGYLWSIASLDFFSERAAPDYLKPGTMRDILVNSIKSNHAQGTKSKEESHDIPIPDGYGTLGECNATPLFDDAGRSYQINFGIKAEQVSDRLSESVNIEGVDIHSKELGEKGLESLSRKDTWTQNLVGIIGGMVKTYSKVQTQPSTSKLNSGWFPAEGISQPNPRESFGHHLLEVQLKRQTTEVNVSDRMISPERRISNTSMIMMNSDFMPEAESMEMFDIYVFLNRAIMKASFELYADKSTVKQLLKLDHAKVVEELSNPSSFFSQWLDCCINMTIQEFDRDCKADDSDKDLLEHLTKMFNSIKHFSTTISKALYSLLNEGDNGLDLGQSPADTYVIPIFDVIFNKKTINKQSLKRSILAYSIKMKTFPLKELYYEALLKDNKELRHKFSAKVGYINSFLHPLLVLDDSSLVAALEVIDGKIHYEFVHCIYRKVNTLTVKGEKVQRNSAKRSVAYSRALEHLKKIKSSNSPFEKAIHLLNSVSQITHDITDFYSKSNLVIKVALTAEELFPIAVHLLQSLRDDQIIVDLFICDTFLPCDLKTGNLGYFCNMYITAYHWIAEQKLK